MKRFFWQIIFYLAILIFHWSCSGNNIAEIKVYLFDPKGQIFLKNNAYKKSKFYRIYNARSINHQITIQSKGFSSAQIQINQFLSIHIEEKTILSINIKKIYWNDQWQANFQIDSGSAIFHYNGNEKISNMTITANEYFLIKNPVSFHLTKINEEQTIQKKVITNTYLTAIIIKGGLHYISPITRQIDMYLAKDQKFYIKNGIPSDIQPLNSEELTFWAKKHKQTIFTQRTIQEKLYLTGGKKSPWITFLIIALLIIAISTITVYFYYSRRNRINRHLFQGALTYWEINNKFTQKKTVQLNKRKGRHKIYIGKRGYCHIKIRTWNKKRRAVIRGHLKDGEEYYTLHHFGNEIAFMNKQVEKRLSHNDEFIIHNYQFVFQIGNKNSYKNRSPWSRR